MGRTITIPATGAGIISSDIRAQLQILENEISGTSPNANYIPVPSALSTTGTASSSTFLRGDGSWQSVPQGTVTAVSVATANGVSGSSSGGTTPSLTIALGAITPTSVNGNTITTGTGTLTFGTGKTLKVDNTLEFAGTDSTVMTFPGTSATIARTDAAQTFTGVQIIPQILCADNGVTAVSNAATVTRSNRNNVVTNNSASGLTITLSTTGATAGDMLLIQALPSSAASQTITWVNTENSAISPNANLNSSTTSPTTDGFKWNPLTSKWRCIASS